jgi:hypothetical protein
MLFKGLDQYFAASNKTEDGKNQIVFRRDDKMEGHFVLYPKVEEDNFLLDFWEDSTPYAHTSSFVQAFTCESKISEITTSSPFCMTLELTHHHFPNPNSSCARGFHIRELLDFTRQVVCIGNPEFNYLACNKSNRITGLPWYVVLKSILLDNYTLPQTLFLLDRKRYQEMEHILSTKGFIPELVEICFLFECSNFVDTVPSLEAEAQQKEQLQQERQKQLEMQQLQQLRKLVESNNFILGSHRVQPC